MWNRRFLAHPGLSSLVAAVFVLLTLAAPAPAQAADSWSEPYPGVRYLARTTSEPNRIHAVFVDRCAVGVSAHVTRPADRGLQTSTFASRYGAQIAINGGFYDTATYAPIGLTIGEGERWTDSGDDATFGFAAFGPRGRAELSNPTEVVATPAEWMENVVAGYPMLVENGQVVIADCFSHMCERHPRSAIGMDAEGRTLVLVVVDGRWAGVSRGMTRIELAELMIDLGAWRALNLDGGGSSTLYVAGLGGVVNHPSDGTERFVSNHLGFTAGGAVDYARCCLPETVPGASGVFADLAADHWARAAAETLYELGITNGCQATPLFFCPDCLLVRAHAAAFLARALALPDHRPATPTFSDVPADHTFYGVIEALYAAGYVSGCSTAPPRFCPDGELSRAEAATFMTRVLGADGLSVQPPSFSDCPADAWYTPFVERVRAACIATGCDPAAGLFCPTDPITRAEFASMLVRTLELGDFTNCQGGSCTPDAWEPDDSAASANPIAPGTTQTRTLCPTGDEDWWRFQLAAPADVVVETAGASGDTRMWLLDAALVELAFDDDGGAGTFSRIVFGGLPAGTWYVRVDEYGDDEALDGYTLSLTASGACVADCAGRSCGDDGCGGACGTCPGGWLCDADGACVPVCAPDCAGLECGPDGCGGSCGGCPVGERCDLGRCVSGCTSDCAGRACGDDGCGGSCGVCQALAACVAGRCVADCTPDCAGHACGPDGCGGLCGSCRAGEACVDGLCVAPCAPDCAGRACGDDGCGGSCGTCPAGERCDAGACTAGCAPDCADRECGPDGCSGSCGACAAGESCVEGACKGECTADCDGRECGPDGCGGSCGACFGGEHCTNGVCAGDCVASCAGRDCGPDGCGGACGECAFGEPCVDGVCIADCVPDCSGRACGSDGCDASCGTCPAGATCDAGGHCAGGCQPACEGRICGPDGCGGVCGACPAETACGDDGLCHAGCLPACGDRECGGDGCGGICGSCAGGATCDDATGRCETSCAPDCRGRLCGDDGCGASCGTCPAGLACTPDGTCGRPPDGGAVPVDGGGSAADDGGPSPFHTSDGSGGGCAVAVGRPAAGGVALLLFLLVSLAGARRKKRATGRWAGVSPWSRGEDAFGARRCKEGGGFSAKAYR